MSNISFLPEAEQDYEEAFAWYFGRSERAAAGLEAAMDQATDKIAQAPERYPLCDDQHHYVILKRYPYRIIYRIEKANIVIVAVAHGRRKPNFWKKRSP